MTCWWASNLGFKSQRISPIFPQRSQAATPCGKPDQICCLGPAVLREKLPRSNTGRPFDTSIFFPQLSTAPNRRSPGWNGPMPHQKTIESTIVPLSRLPGLQSIDLSRLHKLRCHDLASSCQVSESRCSVDSMSSHNSNFNSNSIQIKSPVIKLGALYCRLCTCSTMCAWTFTNNRHQSTTNNQHHSSTVSISVSTFLHNLSVWPVTWSNVYCSYVWIYDLYRYVN